MKSTLQVIWSAGKIRRMNFSRAATIGLFAFVIPLASAQQLVSHELEDPSGLINGLAMTYKTPQGWLHQTLLAPGSTRAVAAAKDDSMGYLFWTGTIFPFTRGGMAGNPQVGQTPPNSVEDYLRSYPASLGMGKIVKILDHKQHQVLATGSGAVAQTGYIHGILRDPKGKDHEIYTSATIQVVASRTQNFVSGSWLVENVIVLNCPQGQLDKIGKIFTRCAPTYQFTREYSDALSQWFARQNGYTIARGEMETARINHATDEMVRGFTQYIGH